MYKKILSLCDKMCDEKNYSCLKKTDIECENVYNFFFSVHLQTLNFNIFEPDSIEESDIDNNKIIALFTLIFRNIQLGEEISYSTTLIDNKIDDCKKMFKKIVSTKDRSKCFIINSLDINKIKSYAILKILFDHYIFYINEPVMDSFINYNNGILIIGFKSIINIIIDDITDDYIFDVDVAKRRSEYGEYGAKGRRPEYLKFSEIYKIPTELKTKIYRITIELKNVQKNQRLVIYVNDYEEFLKDNNLDELYFSFIVTKEGREDEVERIEEYY